MATFELYRYNSGEFGWRLMDGERVVATNGVRDEAPHAEIVDLTGE